MMTDPIADMLTRIRNASLAKHKRVDMPVSKLKTEIARILKDSHFIQDYKVLDDGASTRALTTCRACGADSVSPSSRPRRA